MDIEDVNKERVKYENLVINIIEDIQDGPGDMGQVFVEGRAGEMFVGASSDCFWRWFRR